VVVFVQPFCDSAAFGSGAAMAAKRLWLQRWKRNGAKIFESRCFAVIVRREIETFNYKNASAQSLLCRWEVCVVCFTRFRRYCARDEELYALFAYGTKQFLSIVSTKKVFREVFSFLN
jgi:hypothetical protein